MVNNILMSFELKCKFGRCGYYGRTIVYNVITDKVVVPEKATINHFYINGKQYTAINNTIQPPSNKPIEVEAEDKLYFNTEQSKLIIERKRLKKIYLLTERKSNL
jgi:hypothetical protein